MKVRIKKNDHYYRNRVIEAENRQIFCLNCLKNLSKKAEFRLISSFSYFLFSLPSSLQSRPTLTSTESLSQSLEPSEHQLRILQSANLAKVSTSQSRSLTFPSLASFYPRCTFTSSKDINCRALVTSRGYFLSAQMGCLVWVVWHWRCNEKNQDE